MQGLAPFLHLSMQRVVRMDKLSEIDLCYKKYIKDLSRWLPDGLIVVDIDLLQELDLLAFHSQPNDPGFTRYFQVIESDEKITLVNDQFIVWIVPEKHDDEAYTYIIIATNTAEVPHLELAFRVSGAYNTSRLVLRLLEKYLHDIQETEESLRHIR